MPETSIEYRITLKVVVEAGRSDNEPDPFEKEFFASCDGSVSVERAQRLTTPVSMGGPV